MNNVLICKKCGDELGLKYENTIDLAEITQKYFYKQIIEIEELNTKLHSCRSIISICAERLLEDESGALWTAYDTIKDIENKLDEKITSLMQVYKESKGNAL